MAALAVALVSLAPVGAQAGTATTAFVPANLLAEVTAQPDTTFKVIVQGADGRGTGAVAGDVTEERAAEPAEGTGIRRRFALLSGLSADLTGRQIQKLARHPGIAAITEDSRVAPADAPPAAPTNTVAPAVSGTAQEGTTLTASDGTWSGAPTAFAYDWLRCGTGPRRSALLADSPVGLWPLDADGADAGGHGLDGAASGGFSFDAGAVQLDGLTGAVTVPGVGSASLASGFTIEAWIKLSAPQTTRGIAGQWSSVDGGALLRIDETGRYALAVTSDAANYLVTDVSPVVGEWEHVAGTWDGSSLRLYVNGKEVGSKAWGGPNGAPTTPFTIGDYDGIGHHLEGAIANVALYDHPLQAAQLDRHFSGCEAIAGATAPSYTATAGDVGASLRVAVTATNSVASSAATSAATETVASAPPPATPSPPPPSSPAHTVAPSVPGSPVAGHALTADPGVWTAASDAVTSFAWLSCDAAGANCHDLAGATGQTYVPTPADAGRTLRVVVTVTDSAGSASATSEATAVVTAPPPENVVAPTVAGTPLETSTLSADVGVWSGAAPLTYAYRWQRCDATGSGCLDIEGATAQTYTLTRSDVHASVRVVVEGSNAVGTSVAPSAAASVAALPNRQLWPYVTGNQLSWTSQAAAPAIAIVDSGVDASRADFGGRVVRQVNLASQTPNSDGDGRGHGTFVAGIAAGEAEGYVGAEPKANIVSLDVLNDNGMATIADVIAAADWIYEHKDEYNIRVANFSLTGSVATRLWFDPLDRAVEKLWLSGVVVVAAAGNYAVDGQKSGVLYAPANDPFVITVGATDIANTIATADDFSAPWSAFGDTLDGFAKPEVSAPGRYVVGPVPPGSTLAQQMPERIVEPGYMQMSGTSFAAPMVSGAAALLLAEHPSWTPDQVKGALMLTATPVPAAVPMSAGTGEIDVAGAMSVDDPPNANLPLERFLDPDPNGGPTPIFDAGAWGSALSSGAWGSGAWGSGAWGSGAWGSGAWGSGAWGSGAWGSAYWSAGAWGSGADGSDLPTTGAGGTAAAADARAGGGYLVTSPADIGR